MADINTQPVLFTSTGMLSAQTGPNGVKFPTDPNVSGDQISRRPWRIAGICVVKTGAAGSIEIFDASAVPPTPNANQEVFETDVNGVYTNLGILCKSGDIYVKITGGYKVWLYLDLNR